MLAIPQAYLTFAQNQPRHALDWVNQLRASSLRYATQQGFPTTQNEAWKYTKLDRLTKEFFLPGLHNDNNLKPTSVEGLDAATLYIHNGHLVSHDGAAFTQFSKEPEKFESYFKQHSVSSSLNALNSALLNDIVRITEAPSKPLHIIYSNTQQDASYHTRVVIDLPAHSSLTLIESFHGSHAHAAYWHNNVVDITLADHASCHHYTLQHESDKAIHTRENHVHGKAHSRYQHFYFARGAQLGRQYSQVILEGMHAECALFGLVLAKGSQRMDFHPSILHATAECKSSQIVKQLVNDKAQANYYGQSIVPPKSQQSIAKQLNRNLLLSPHAKAMSRPELLIHADDVECAHGSATGPLDRDALFYLRARGMEEADARHLLIEGFSEEMLEYVELEPLKQWIHKHITDWL